MVASLTRMNASNDKPLVVLEGTPAPTTYLIHIQRHEAWPDLTAGMTQKGAETCSVDISTELFKSDRESYMDSVVWHELGHCAGLNHNPNKGTMMYAIAKPFSTLATSAVKDFFIDMEKSLWSEPLGH